MLLLRGDEALLVKPYSLRVIIPGKHLPALL
jgi:hypothetical protein